MDNDLERVGRILNLAVDKEHRRKGIGFILVHSILNKYKADFSRITLEVSLSNQAAIQLYTKLGFKIEMVMLKYYGDNEDAYLMTRKYY